VRPIFARLAISALDRARSLAESLRPNGFLRDQAVEALIERAETSEPGALLAWAKAPEPGFGGYGDAMRDFTDMGAYMIRPDDWQSGFELCAT